MTSHEQRHFLLVLAMSQCLAACTPTPAKTTPVDIPRASTSAGPTKPIDGPPNMAYLQGGRFKPISADTAVSIASFWLDKTEVTSWEYRSCVRERKCSEKGIFCDEDFTYGTQKKDHPVNCVDQSQAIAYCAFVGKRLPTTEEWEWAARGGRRGTKYPWGDAEPSNQLCWKRFDFNTAKGEGTCPVKSFPAGNTPSGISDLEGNVSEWTSTLSPNSDEYAFIRGHNWTDMDPVAIWIDLHSGGLLATVHLPSVGFRCALSVDFTNAP